MRMHTYLRQIYDAFGPSRIFWGTDITKLDDETMEDSP